jgi:hypothetical protein
VPIWTNGGTGLGTIHGSGSDSNQRGEDMMLLRALTLSVLCGSVFFGISLGDSAQAAKKPPRCMEAVTTKNCTPASNFYCTKKAKCGSCAQWTCGKRI